MDRPHQRELCWLHYGTLPYRAAFDLQLRLWQQVWENPAGPDYLITLQHPPTVTVGRSGGLDELLVPPQTLCALGVELVETNRGGRLTYHGPGQLVAYPVVDLRHHGRDLHRYMRRLEAWLIDLCSTYGLEARANPPHTGVWIQHRKVASIGIAVRRWVAYHGVALNVSTDLEAFRLIVPCGLPDVEMTSLERELGQAPRLEEVAERAAQLFAARFGLTMHRAEVHL